MSSWTEVGRPFEPGYDERRVHSRFRADDVIHIRRLIAAGWSDAQIAEVYGVARNTIYYIRTERTWASLEQPPDNGHPPVPEPPEPAHRSQSQRGERNPYAKLTRAKVRAIRALSAAGWSDGEVGKVFGITAVAVLYIRRGIRWGWLDKTNGKGRPT